MEFDRFVDSVRSLLAVDIPTTATPEDNLYDDLGFDSIQAFELLIVTESLADSLAMLPETPQLYTLGDAYDYYERLKAAEAELLG